MTPPDDNKNSSPLARRWWLNLALLITISALGLFAWYRINHSPQDTKSTLTELTAASIQRIKITYQNQPPTELERKEDGWRLIAPIKARGDSFAIDSLLRLARAPVEANVTPIDNELGRYGLDQPTLTVRFDDKEIRFGNMHPLKDNYYVQHGSTVSLISSRYYAQAAMKYNGLIDSRLLEPGRKPISFKLKNFSLTRKDATWQRQPEISALSSDSINAFVDDWLHARALQVEKYSGRKAEDRVVIVFEEEDKQIPLTIEILARTPELILARPDEGLEYHFPTETGQRLLNLNVDTPK